MTSRVATPVFDANFPRVDGVTAEVYEVPTDRPEADGTLAWSKTTLVLARVTGGGAAGLGYTYASGACKPLIEGELAAAVAGVCTLDTGAAWLAMARAVRNLGRPGLVSCAISAVDAALWDLKATLLDVPLSRLLGLVWEEVPVYGSGGFTTYDEPAARAQLERWTGDLRIPRVKIKIGESWGTAPSRDLARVAFARSVIGPDAELYVDANGGYSCKQAAVRIARAMADCQVSWFEEPVSSDDLDGLREVRDQVDPYVTAGEYGYDLPYFARMVGAQAVDCLQVDVTRCGAASPSSSCAPPPWPRPAACRSPRTARRRTCIAHVCAAVPNLRHLEYFHDHARIERLFFDGALDPSGGALRPGTLHVGHGLSPSRSPTPPRTAPPDRAWLLSPSPGRLACAVPTAPTGPNRYPGPVLDLADFAEAITDEGAGWRSGRRSRGRRGR